MHKFKSETFIKYNSNMEPVSFAYEYVLGKSFVYLNVWVVGE